MCLDLYNAVLELDRDVNAARNIGVRGFGPGSGGTLPDAMRHIRSVVRRFPPPGGRPQADIAEQHRTVDSAAVNFSL